MNGKSLPILSRSDSSQIISVSSHFNNIASYLDYLIIQENNYLKNTNGKSITFVLNANSPKKTIESINLPQLAYTNLRRQANKQLWDDTLFLRSESAASKLYEDNGTVQKVTRDNRFS